MLSHKGVLLIYNFLFRINVKTLSYSTYRLRICALNTYNGDVILFLLLAEFRAIYEFYCCTYVNTYNLFCGYLLAGKVHSTKDSTICGTQNIVLNGKVCLVNFIARDVSNSLHPSNQKKKRFMTRVLGREPECTEDLMIEATKQYYDNFLTSNLPKATFA
uniref:Pepsin-I3 domain-containing protein n=1 Tax=Heterorhabditis bacteriophora TaxID=37862 RepID=A0A1I7WZC5_HETBA